MGKGSTNIALKEELEQANEYISELKKELDRVRTDYNNLVNERVTAVSKSIVQLEYATDLILKMTNKQEG